MSLPKARVTICAIAPTRDRWVGTDRHGNEENGTVWQFRITNSGTATAFYDAWILYNGREWYATHDKRAPAECARGVLPAGAAIITNLLVVTRSNNIWAGEVAYTSQRTALANKLQLIAYRMPWLADLCPGFKNRYFTEPSHSETNADFELKSSQNGTNR